MLTPLADIQPLRSNCVTLTPERSPFEVYFNRGIVATQALAHALGDQPSVDALTPHIQKAGKSAKKKRSVARKARA